MLTGLNYVILDVPSIEKAATFYTEKLGFVVEERHEGFIQFKQPEGSGAMFALQEKADTTALQSVELWWFVDNADATCATLLDRGVEIVSKPTDEPFGRAFAIKDPAGHTLHLLQLPHHS